MARGWRSRTYTGRTSMQWRAPWRLRCDGLAAWDGSVGGADVASDLPDLVQEVFTRAFEPKTRRRFDGERPYGPYLGRIAHNVVVDYFRRKQREMTLGFHLLVSNILPNGEARRQRMISPTSRPWPWLVGICPCCPPTCGGFTMPSLCRDCPSETRRSGSDSDAR